MAHERYQSLFKEKREKKATIWSWTRKNLSEGEKQKLVEYRKKNTEWEKIIIIRNYFRLEKNFFSDKREVFS